MSNGGVYAGNYASGNGQSYGYGYTSDGGGRSVSSGSIDGAPFAPPIPDFNNFISQYFDIFGREQQNLLDNRYESFAFSFTSSDPNSKVQAQSSLTFPDGLRATHRAVVAASSGQGFPGGYSGYEGGSGGSYSGGYGGSYNGNSYGGSFGPEGSGGRGSFSSASIGPGGIHQTAALYPENPNVPNVNARFGPTRDGGGGGSYGVFTSSQSETRNINGKPQTFQSAYTTVNDNGKISTYKVHNP